MQKKRKRKRRRRKDYRLQIVIYAIPLLCVILAGIGVVRAFSDKNSQDQEPMDSQASISDIGDEQEDENSPNDGSDGLLADKPGEDGTKDTDSDKNTEKPEEKEDSEDAKKEFTLADLDNPSGFDERPAENGFVLENEQIDLNGLDTTCLDWGQGGDLDEYNRPAGCMQYQEKYGMYNAHFIKDEPEKKVIYLTMDEGYEYGCSDRIMDTLKEKMSMSYSLSLNLMQSRTRSLSNA